jgi:hypothetical protein
VFIAILGVAIGVPLIFPLIPESRAGEVALPAIPEGRYRVFVADWGYHTAIVVEQPPGWVLGPPGEERARFLEFAWGDRRFYMESKYAPHSVFATLALPTSSVIYLDGRADPPSLGKARSVRETTIDATQLRTLLTEIERSFQRGDDGARQPPYPPARGYGGRFFPAHGRYVWTRACNWWTVARLRAAGLARRPTGVLFSRQVSGRLLGFRPAAARRP